MSEEKEKKTAADVIIEQFLKDVEEKESMPWQRPYERFNAFNYFTNSPYRGINRLLLPFGEYMTKNQINAYNKEKGEDFKFQKGIKWYPVVYFSTQKKQISKEEVEEAFPNFTPSGDDTEYIGNDGKYTYFYSNGIYYKKRNILKYYLVTDRKYIKNSKGEMLPSKIESGEVQIIKQDPMNVINSYIDREGLEVDFDYGDVPCYIPALDKILLNPHTKNEESWFSTAFHEIGHSTGASHRLNRPGVTFCNQRDVEQYAEEECVAEICACLCCSETGVYDYKTSGTVYYDNSIAYVQAWKKKIQEWGKSFIYIVSQADKAFNYICNSPDEYLKSENGDVLD